jgi:hypothetical protein
LRRLLEDRFSQILGDIDSLVADARDQARRDLAEQLNQSARRLAQASGDEEIAVTLADVASSFAAGAIVFRIEKQDAFALVVRGVPEETMERFRGLRIPLRDAAALAGAVESREPVVAVTSAAEVSPAVVDRLEHSVEGRASLFPIAVRDRIAAVVYAWGDVQRPVLELLAQVASGAAWSEPERPLAIQPDLLQIAPARRTLTWESLPPAEQEIHLRAQRFARVQAAEIRLHEGDVVQRGRTRKNLYSVLRDRIDPAREAFRREFFTNCPSMVDYLHLELVRTLANDDADALGKEYPGPLV